MSSWTSTRLSTGGDVVNYLQPGVHLCCVCVCHNRGRAGGWIIWVYRLEQQRRGAEERGRRRSWEDATELWWCSVSDDRRQRMLLDTANLSEHSFGCLVFSNLISNLPNEVVTIFGHELVSWLFVDLLLHSLWWCFWVIAKENML